VRLGGITRTFINRFKGWDNASRLSFVIAGVLMVALVLFGGNLPDELRQNALIAVAGLFITMQAVFLYANRGMVSALTAAQRQYLTEDFVGARQTLENALENRQRPDFRALTLLGNTYRQLGLSDNSFEILTKAVQAAPHHHFPWYGFGRTLMTLGRYGEAVEAFQRALAEGAPAVAQLDHAEALYRAAAGSEMVLHALAAAEVGDDEPYRALWSAYLRWRITGKNPPSRDLINAGMAYWEAMAERFTHTPYGRSISADLKQLQEIV